MDNRLRDTAKELANHGSLELLGDTVESLLDDMAPESIHAQRNGITPDGIGNALDLFLSAVLKATLNKKVAKTVDHELISLRHNGIHDCVFLVGCADLELLLQKD